MVKLLQLYELFSKRKLKGGKGKGEGGEEEEEIMS